METVPWGAGATPPRQATWNGCVELWYDCAAAYLGRQLPQGWRQRALTSDVRAREMAALRRWRRQCPGSLTPKELRRMIVWYWLLTADPLNPHPRLMAGLQHHWHEWRLWWGYYGPCVDAEGIVGTCRVCLTAPAVTPTDAEALRALLNMLEVRRG